MTRGRYYDPVTCRFLSMSDRFGNAYSDGDHGSMVIFAFQALSMMPGVGAPFAMAIAFYDISEGDYVSGALGITGALIEAVGISAMSDAWSAAKSRRQLEASFAVARKP
jgi:hypothetical protein